MQTLVSTTEAMAQVNEIDEDATQYVESLIDRAIGLVESDLGRAIYATAAEVPTDEEAPIILESLKATRKAALKAAVLLILADLYAVREASTVQTFATNPAYIAATASFRRVLIG
jgi:hypothetical protein